MSMHYAFRLLTLSPLAVKEDCYYHHYTDEETEACRCRRANKAAVTGVALPFPKRPFQFCSSTRGAGNQGGDTLMRTIYP